MKEYTYHKDLRRLLSSVGKMLDGIVLRRYVNEGGGDVVDEIAVPVKYAPKSRVLHALTNLSNHIQLPIISYQLTGVKYDENRTFNKIAGFNLPESIDKNGRRIPQPVPVNLSISVSFLGRFEGDAEQFITCLYTKFYPYVALSYEFPEIGTEIRSKFIWNGDIRLTYPDELDATKPYRCEVTSDFTLEGWMFKNIPKEGGRIYNIPVSFTAVPEITSVDEMNDFRRYSLDVADERYLPTGAKFEDETHGINTDFVTVSGRAWVGSCPKTEIGYDDEMKIVQLGGNMFTTTSAVILTDATSGHLFPEEEYHLYDFYSSDKSLSHFGTVSGVSAPYEVISDNILLVQIPDYDSRGGRIDVKVLGEFGMGSLMEDSRRAFVSNPDKTPPAISGIQLLGENK